MSIQTVKPFRTDPDMQRFAYYIGKLIDTDGNVLIQQLSSNTLFLGDGEPGDKVIYFNRAGTTEDNPAIQWSEEQNCIEFSYDNINWYPIKYLIEGDGIKISGEETGPQNTISVNVSHIIDTDYGLKEDNNNIQIALKENGGLKFTSGEIETDEANIPTGGDISGNLNAITVVKIQGSAVSSTAPTDGQLLQWVAGSSQWVPTTVSFTSTFTGLTDCPSSYTGKAGCIPIVNAVPDGLEFASLDTSNTNGEIKFDYDTTNKILGAESQIDTGLTFYGGRAFRQTITVDHNQVSGSGTISEYMWRVIITDASHPVFTASQTDGDDITFTDTCDNLLPFRLVTFDRNNHILIAWVLADVSAVSDTTIRMYYGSSTATSEADITTTTADYEALYPLDEDLNDYGGRAKHGTNAGTTQDTNGQSCNARSFDGSSYFHNGLDGWRCGEFGEGVIGMWVKHTISTQADLCGNHRNPSSSQNKEQFRIMLNTNTAYAQAENKVSFIVIDPIGNTIHVGTTNAITGLNDGNWHHLMVGWRFLSGNYPSSTGADYFIMVDGVSQACSVVVANATNQDYFAQYDHTWYYNFTFGCWNDCNTLRNFYTGSLDNIWFIPSYISSDYLITLFNNESDPNGFYTLGGIQSVYSTGQELFDQFIEPAKDHVDTEDAINGLVKVDGAGGYSAVTDNSTNWNTAYTNRVDTWTSPLQCSSNTASILDATTSQKGAVQLQDSIDSTTTKAVTPNAVMTYAQPLTYPMGRYYLSSGQTISDSNWTTLQLAKDWEINSGDGGWDAGNYRFVVPTGQSGYYNVVINSLWSSSNPGGTCRIAIYWYDYSASTWAYKSYAHSYQTASKNLELTLNDIIQADAGDYIQIRVYHNSGSDATVSGSGDKFYTSATITRVA